MIVKRLVGGYMAMVGVPLLIILLVFNAGSKLVAPPSIDGAWVMQPESPAAAEACPKELADLAGGSLVISQSGRHLTAHWNQDKTSRMSGVLDQREFILCSLDRSNEECKTDPLHLNGRILEENGARRLEVRLLPDSADDCKELTLRSGWREINLEARPPTEHNY